MRVCYSSLYSTYFLLLQFGNTNSIYICPGNNDTAMTELGQHLEFEGSKRRVRCFGHIVNLAAAALLFGKDASKVEDLLGSERTTALAKHKYQKKRSDRQACSNRSEFLTNSLLEKQRVAFAASNDAKIRAQTPVKVISYVATRWLSMLQVIRRAVKLRKYLHSRGRSGIYTGK